MQKQAKQPENSRALAANCWPTSEIVGRIIVLLSLLSIIVGFLFLFLFLFYLYFFIVFLNFIIFLFYFYFNF